MTTHTRQDDAGRATFTAADLQPPHQPERIFICAGCGYGAFLTHQPARCPICGEYDWLPDPDGAARSDSRPATGVGRADGASPEWDCYSHPHPEIFLG